jgi:putative glutamine amidotransferase
MAMFLDRNRSQNQSGREQPRRPVIGVTGPDDGGQVAWWFLRLAIARAGGTPRRITPSRPYEATRLDGLLVGGGADVQDKQRWPDSDGSIEGLPASIPDESKTRRLLGLGLTPLVYGLRRVLGRSPDLSDPQRDRLELDLLREAADLRLPVLGICRGAQIMNVFAGGTLPPGLTGYYEEDPQPWSTLPCKPVDIEPHSRLREVLGLPRCYVNSWQRQVVDRLGRDLTIVARQPDGVVQAFEHQERPLWMGVQWHPEYLPHYPIQRRLFTALVAVAHQQSAMREPNMSRTTLDPAVSRAVRRDACPAQVTWLPRRRQG